MSEAYASWWGEEDSESEWVEQNRENGEVSEDWVGRLEYMPERSDDGKGGLQQARRECMDMNMLRWLGHMERMEDQLVLVLGQKISLYLKYFKHF